MKVAFLIWTQGNPEGTGLIFSTEALKAVINKLDALGWDVEKIVCDTVETASSDQGMCSLSLTSLINLSGFFERAHDYGLIVNLCGAAPLLMSGITDTPMLNVLNQPTYRQHSKFYDSYSTGRHFVWCESSVLQAYPLPGPVIDMGSGSEREVIEKISDGLFKAGKELLKRLQKEDHRPWGYYVVLSDLDDHKVKRIVVYPDKRLSLQSHKRRSEHWMVVSGKGVVTLDSNEVELGPGDSVDIPVGTRHRMTNRENEPVVFIEVQTGDYFGEDDIERYEDDFGRA